MRSVQKVSVLIRAYFEVYDSAQAPVTGLLNTDFTKLLIKDGVDDATVVTVAEVSSGRYQASFTPGSAGAWHLTIRNATYNKRGWHETFDVNTGGVLAANDIADALLDRANAIDTYTVRNAFKFVAAMLAGKVSGSGTSGDPYIFRSLDDSADRVTMQANSAGDRTVVTLTP